MTISSPRRKAKAQRRVVDHANSRRSVASWVMWDVGSSSFDSIMTTFIFTVYLTSSYFGTPEETSSALFLGLTIAGFLFFFTKKKKCFAKVDNFLTSAHCIFIHVIASYLIDGSIVGINLFVVKNNTINHSKTLRLKVTYKNMFSSIQTYSF